MTLMEALMKLDLIIDESDPDVSGLVRYLGGWGGGGSIWGLIFKVTILTALVPDDAVCKLCLLLGVKTVALASIISASN